MAFFKPIYNAPSARETSKPCFRQVPAPPSFRIVGSNNSKLSTTPSSLAGALEIQKDAIICIERDAFWLK